MIMFLDAQCLLSDAQAVTTDAVSTNAYDTGAAGNDITEGEPLGVVITVDVAADFTTGDETYTFEVIQDDDAALGSPLILVSKAILASDLTLGSRHVIPIPPGSKTLRYIGMNYNTAGTSPTITVTAAIGPLSMIGGGKKYADGITIQ